MGIFTVTRGTFKKGRHAKKREKEREKRRRGRGREEEAKAAAAAERSYKGARDAANARPAMGKGERDREKERRGEANAAGVLTQRNPKESRSH